MSKQTKQTKKQPLWIVKKDTGWVKSPFFGDKKRIVEKEINPLNNQGISAGFSYEGQIKPA